MKKPLLTWTVLAAASLFGVGTALTAAPAPVPQEAPSAASASDSSAPPHNWTAEQAVTSTVREAWALGGKTPEGFFEIVKTLAGISAQKRGVAIPNNERSGTTAGDWIKKQAKKDPDQLLYVIVDQAVQRSADKTASAQ